MIRRASIVAAALGSAVFFTFSGTALAQDRDCADFSSRQEAQAAFEGQAGDPERLDADNDNLACESLDGGGSAPAEDVSGGQGQTTGGDEDSGAAPTGGVEAGHGGMAGRPADAIPVGLAGAALLAAGGVAAFQRWTGRSE